MRRAEILLALSFLASLAACVGGRPQLPPPVMPLSATPVEEFRSAPPEAGPTAELRLPDINVDQLDNGLTLIHLQRPGSHVAAIRFVTRRGGEDGPRNKAGLSWMTGEVIGSHTAGASPLGEEHLLEQHGLRPDVTVDRELAALSLWMTTDRLPQALELVARTLREPILLPSNVERARAAAHRQIEFYWSNSERSSISHARRALFGPEHRATYPIWGTRESVSLVTREQIMAHYRATWIPLQSALVVVGDIEHETFVEMANRLFGSWHVPERAPERDQPPLQPPWSGARIMARATSSPQSLVLLMERAPSRRSPDFVAFGVLTRILGQMFSSRLNLMLREERGYSYGVHAQYNARSSDGDLLFVTHVSPRRLSNAMRAVVGELRRLRDEGPTEEELATASILMREELVESMETCASASAYLAELFADGYSPEEILRLERELRELDVARVRAVALRWLRPDEAPMVVTGPQESLGYQIETARVGRWSYLR